VSFLAAVGDPARFFVSATGTLLEFQWRKNGVPIPGANGANLQFTTASFAEAGAFDVVVSNSAGSVVSVPATLSFGQLPPGLAPPSLQVRLGEPAIFSVSPPASGAGPTYLWTRGGVEFARNTALFAADGTAQGTLSPGQLIPANRWTTPNGGAMFAAGIGPSETGQVAGATNQPALGLGVVGAPDLGSYSVAVTVDGVRQERGTGLLTLRGYGRLGRRLFAVGGAGTHARRQQRARGGSGEADSVPMRRAVAFCQSIGRCLSRLFACGEKRTDGLPVCPAYLRHHVRAATR
jgi:hypothetical protein